MSADGPEAETDWHDQPAPVSGFHYAMQRVLGPAMAVVVFVVSLIVIPVMIAGNPPPISAPILGLLFVFASLGFWAWARHVDGRAPSGEEGE